MAIRDQIRDNAQPYLQPGEQIQVAFGAQNILQYWVLLGWLPFLIGIRYKVVVVTDQRIIIGKAGKFRQTPFTEVIGWVPRGTVIGPPKGGAWFKATALGKGVYVHRRFFKDIREADELLAA